jgi:hypothetical protein
LSQRSRVSDENDNHQIDEGIIMKPFLDNIATLARAISMTFGTAGLIVVAMLVTFSAPVTADGTPDGTTPANEGVCDVLKGGTPGLYGLCVAYCEAQDLDSFDKDPPNTKILNNYRKKMQAGDPDMPCVKVPCPCWTSAELGSITADNMAAACPAATGKLQIIDNSLKTHFAEANVNAGAILTCRPLSSGVSQLRLRKRRVVMPMFSRRAAR